MSNRKKSYGARVQVLMGMTEFVGKTGTVVGWEKDGRTWLNRVKLDVPVEVPGVGVVRSDLWASEYLKGVR